MSEGLQYKRCVRLVSPMNSDALLTVSTRSGKTGLKPTDLAWLAGIVDGEGYVFFRSSPCIQVETVTPNLAYVPENLFGGKVTVHQRRDVNVFRWSVYGSTASAILKMILPYLRYKRSQAVIVMNSARYPVGSAMRTAQNQRLTALRKERHRGPH